MKIIVKFLLKIKEWKKHEPLYHYVHYSVYLPAYLHIICWKFPAYSNIKVSNVMLSVVLQYAKPDHIVGMYSYKILR